MNTGRKFASEPSEEIEATRRVAAEAAATDRFPDGIFEIVPGAIYEAIRPLGITYRINIARMMTITDRTRKRFLYFVDSVGADRRWRRTKYQGHGPSEAEALKTALHDICLDQAPLGDA